MATFLHGFKRKHMEDHLQCCKCQLKFVNKRQLHSHEWRCSYKPDANSNTMTYTQGAMNTSLRAGHYALENNCQLREVYNSQLLHQPSIRDLAMQMAESRSDSSGDDSQREGCYASQFNPFADDAQSNNDVDFDGGNGGADVDPESESRDDREDLPTKYLNKMHRYTEMKKKVPKCTKAPERYVYKNTMSTKATCHAELLKILQKHGASKVMFDDIVTWATSWSEKDENVFKGGGRANKWTRKKTLKYLKDVFKTSGLEPTSYVVELHDGRQVSVPVVDFAESMRSILNDKAAMRHVMKGLDPTTWRPTTTEDEHEMDPDAVINDKDSGYMYRQGIKIHVPDADECDEVLVRPFPVIIHIDKSHSDLFGNLAVAPIQVMPAMLDINAQRKSSSWRSIATIPNLSAGKGTHGSKKNKDPLLKLQDYHKVMSVALSSFVKCYEDGGFMWQDEQGRDVLLKPYVHCFVGDIAGVNEMIGHFNTWNSQCPAKDCKCSREEFVNTFPPKCSPVQWAEIQECKDVKEIFKLYLQKGLVSEKDMSVILDDPDYAKAISKHPIKNAFDALPLADPYQGIIGMTPQDMLHMMGVGNFKYFLLGIHDIIGLKDSNSRIKGLVNDIFPDIKEFLRRNSDRGVSRMSNRKGFFNVTSLTSNECRGNFFGFVVFLHTTYGRDLLEPYFKMEGVKYDLLLETCKLVLSWERFYMSSQKRSDFQDAEQATWDLQLRILRDIPRPEREKTETYLGSKGWKIVKFHAISFLTGNVLKFGRADCFDTEANEKNLKFFVKGNAKLTQRISSKFSTQLASNDCDRVVIDLAYEAIKEHCSGDHSMETKANAMPINYYPSDDSESSSDGYQSDSSTESIILRCNENVSSLAGMYHLFIKISGNKRITVRHKWKSPYTAILGVKPSAYIHKTIADSAIKYCTNNRISHERDLTLHCYTGAKIRGVTYRANPYWKGTEWYDWAAVRFPKTVDSVGGSISIARVMGFVTYETKGALTYKSMEMEGLTPDQVSDSVDPTVYAILHFETSYFNMSELEKEFIHKFQTMPASQMYILPARCIIHPMIVVPDIEDATTASKNTYLAVVPKHRMGNYFLHHVQWYKEHIKEMEKEDSD